VANRLRFVLGLKTIESDLRVWNRFVQRELQDRAGFERCLRFTLYRPRDILVLLNRAYVGATKEGRDHLVDADVDSASIGVSRDRLDDLLKEYQSVLPGLALFVKLFEGRAAFGTMHEIRDLLDEAIVQEEYSALGAGDFALLGSGSEIFSALYSIGFLGLKDPNTTAFSFCHDGSSSTEQEIEASRVTVVHPCYWRALNLRAEEGTERIAIDIDDDYSQPISAEGGVRKEILDIRTRRLGQILAELPKLPLGEEGAQDFEDWVLRTLKMVLAGKLSNIELKPNRDAVQRRDVVATNMAANGFWRRIYEDFGSRQVIFEVKNYEQPTLEDFRQVLSYTGNVYGTFAVLVSRTPIEGMSEQERSWLQEIWAQHKVLIFTLPASLLNRCVSKLRTTRKHDYSEEAFAKRLDTFERAYLAIKASRGRHARKAGK